MHIIILISPNALMPTVKDLINTRLCEKDPNKIKNTLLKNACHLFSMDPRTFSVQCSFILLTEKLVCKENSMHFIYFHRQESICVPIQTSSKK